MIARWPDSLPQAPLADGYQEQAPDLTLRTSMDTGPAKVRRRGAARPWGMQVSLYLTTEQAETLRAFVYDTLSGGALRFMWVHPRTKGAIECRLRGTGESLYTLTPLGVSHWVASLSLEVLP